MTNRAIQLHCSSSKVHLLNSISQWWRFAAIASLLGFSSLVFADCIETGGSEQCSRPQPLPWTYNACDLRNYAGAVYNWCAAAGNPGCENNSAVNFPTDGSVYTVSQQYESIIHGHCAAPGGSDSGWGQTLSDPIVAGLCWSGSPIYSMGSVIRDFRSFSFSGMGGTPCVTPYTDPIYAIRVRQLDCSLGTASVIPRAGGDYACSRVEDNTCSVGNPIQPGSGNKVFIETDFAIGSSPLKLMRRYNSFGFWQPPDSSPASPGLLGDFWRTNYDSHVYRITGSSYAVAAIQRPDGKVKHFTTTGTEVHHFSGTPAETLLPISGGGWTYTTGNDEIETYDASGRLIGIWDKTNLQQTLGYDTAGRLAQVTDAHGRALSFTYTGSIQAYPGGTVTVTTPDGGRYIYTVNEKDNLVSVALPNGASRVYLYEATTHTNAITGILDENSVRYETVEYDINGHAAASYLAPGSAGGSIGRNSFTYNSTTGSTTMVDPLGQSRTLAFTTTNGVINLGSTTQPCSTCGGGSAQSKTYDANGYPDLETDFNGTVTNHDYNARGLETQRVEAFSAVGISGTPPQQRIMQTDWHATFRVPTERRVYNAAMALQSRSTWTYNGRGQILTKTESDPIASHAARMWTYSYCEAANVSAGTCPLLGLLTQVDGSRSDVSDITNYTYRAADDPTCASAGACTYRRGDLWKVTNALGQINETVSYDKNGRATRTKDANGTLTDLSYHPRGWLASRIVRANIDGSASALDATTTFTYDAVGNVTRVTQPDGAYLNYSYDNAHRLTDIADNLNNRIHYTLDAAGNRTQEDTVDPSSLLKRTLSRSYSSLNRLQRTTDALSHISTLGYDPNGNSTSSVDALNTETDQQYDPLNRLVRTLQDVTAPTGTSTRNTTTQYTYDSRDNLTDVTDPDNLVTHYVYDGQNNLTQLQSPDTGTTSYAVDAAGNRVSQTDARGITTTYSYDALNRLTAIRYPTTTLNVTFQYDTVPNECIGGETFTVGRLAKMIDASGETHYCYDRRGNSTRKVQLTTLSFSCGLNTCGGGTTSSVDQTKRGMQSAIIDPGPPNPTNTTVLTLTTRYGYTLADRLSSMTYPSGMQVTYVRNAIGQVNQVSYRATPTAAPVTILGSATYLPFGPMNSLTFGNGRSQTKTYDRNYGIDTIASSSAGGLTLDYTLDAVGNVQDASNTLGLTPPTQRYRYDDLYRLTEVDNSATTMLEGYTYTKTGDRTRKSKQGQADQIYLYPTTSHRLQSVAGTQRTYDADGNLTSQNLSYDARNRLAGWQLQADGTINLVSNSVQYQYNGKGERVAKQSVAYSSGTPLPGDPSGWILGGLAYSYGEGGQMTGEYSVLGQAIVEYLYLDNQPIAIQKGNKLYYIETDHLNTPRQVIDPTRNVAVWKWDFFGSAFGENAPNQDPDSDGIPFILNLRYPGQLYDQETGLNYNYFRDYESTTGRYVESDPIGVNGGINTYSYVSAQPFELVDRLGLAADCDSGESCCKNISWPEKEGGVVGGTVRCCNGKSVACVNPNLCDGSSTDACAIRTGCVKRHEELHKSNHTNCTGQPDGPAPPMPPYNKNSSECEAYRDELRCLSITRCNSTACKAEIRKMQEQAKSQRNKYCSSAGM